MEKRKGVLSSQYLMRNGLGEHLPRGELLEADDPVLVFFPCLLESINRQLRPIRLQVEHGRPVATPSHLMRLEWHSSQATAERCRGFPRLVEFDEACSSLISMSVLARHRL